ncbi:hypothetical protein Rhe02_48760 [Rhizocola hellebori]|uniref:Uncharacterized protein n=1 Tax=Rhizocola hellebori TaxID=1392758 RepID=A0A8J3Q9X9_9ACTN|nr:hypothetical protein [Rhizocola hellebori]GIH06809.1 hypothetical protein Rhe02_48760 [Rhizocola hellebori]
MAEDQGQGTVTTGELHDLADSNLASALIAQGVEPGDLSAGLRELSLSQYALLSIATSLREIAKLQSELNHTIYLLTAMGAEGGERNSRRKRRN